MERLPALNEFFRIRRLREGMRAWEELWRLLADGPLARGRRWLRHRVPSARTWSGPLWPLSMLSRRIALITPTL